MRWFLIDIWQVFRYFNYLDNVYYTRLFTFRITQTLVVLLYFTHFLACIIFMIACPSESRWALNAAYGLSRPLICIFACMLKFRFKPPVCKENSWLRSYEVQYQTNPNVKYKKLSQNMPYLLSFYFAAATLTSAGVHSLRWDYTACNIFTVFNDCTHFHRFWWFQSSERWRDLVHPPLWAHQFYNHWLLHGNFDVRAVLHNSSTVSKLTIQRFCSVIVFTFSQFSRPGSSSSRNFLELSNSWNIKALQKTCSIELWNTTICKTFCGLVRHERRKFSTF